MCMVTRDYEGHRAGERPQVEVCMGDVWYAGELRAWIRRTDTWWAHIDYTLPDSTTHVVTVPGSRLRSDDPRAHAPDTRLDQSSCGAPSDGE